jgi:hypothetical protein
MQMLRAQQGMLLLDPSVVDVYNRPPENRVLSEAPTTPGKS